MDRCPVVGGAALDLEGNPTMKPAAVLDTMLSNTASMASTLGAGGAALALEVFFALVAQCTPCVFSALGKSGTQRL